MLLCKKYDKNWDAWEKVQCKSISKKDWKNISFYNNKSSHNNKESIQLNYWTRQLNSLENKLNSLEIKINSYQQIMPQNIQFSLKSLIIYAERISTFLVRFEGSKFRKEQLKTILGLFTKF